MPCVVVRSQRLKLPCHALFLHQPHAVGMVTLLSLVSFVFG
jgi:hypothetical protein